LGQGIVGQLLTAAAGLVLINFSIFFRGQAVDAQIFLKKIAEVAAQRPIMFLFLQDGALAGLLEKESNHPVLPLVFLGRLKYPRHPGMLTVQRGDKTPPLLVKIR